MKDVVEMIRANVRKDDVRREQIRRDFPGCTSIIDDFRAEFLGRYFATRSVK